jgi:hypothetical protein
MIAIAMLGVDTATKGSPSNASGDLGRIGAVHPGPYCVEMGYAADGLYNMIFLACRTPDATGEPFIEAGVIEGVVSGDANRHGGRGRSFARLKDSMMMSRADRDDGGHIGTEGSVGNEAEEKWETDESDTKES